MRERRLQKRIRALRKKFIDPGNTDHCAMSLQFEFYDGIAGPLWYVRPNFIWQDPRVEEPLYGPGKTLSEAVEKAERGLVALAGLATSKGRTS